MKKFTLFTAVLFVAYISQAQISKGSTFIGGSVSGFSTESENEVQNSEDKNSRIGVGLEFGKFFATNKVAGVFVNYYNEKDKTSYGTSYPVDQQRETHGLGGGVFYRQYFPLSTKWYLFGEGTLGYNQNKLEEKRYDKVISKDKGWNIAASITPGISFAVSKRLFIETAFGNLLTVSYGKSETDHYNTITGLVTSTTENKNFSAYANTEGLSSFQFGLRWILPGKN